MAELFIADVVEFAALFIAELAVFKVAVAVFAVMLALFIAGVVVFKVVFAEPAVMLAFFKRLTNAYVPSDRTHSFATDDISLLNTIILLETFAISMETIIIQTIMVIMRIHSITCSTLLMPMWLYHFGTLWPDNTAVAYSMDSFIFDICPG